MAHRLRGTAVECYTVGAAMWQSFPKESTMKWPKGTPRHEIAPAEWRNTPNFTGSYELDAVIHKNPNPDLKHRMAMYGGHGGTVYGQKTAYTGYEGYEKDD